MRKLKPFQGVFSVNENDESSFLNTYWEQPTHFDDAGFAPVCTDHGWGFINAEGFLIIPDEYEFISEFLNNTCVVRKAGKWGLIDRQNCIVFPFRYDSLVRQSTEGKDLFIASHKGEWGILDENAAVVVPFSPVQITSCSNSVYTFKNNGKYGVCDFTGNTLINPDWAHLQTLGDHFCAGKETGIFFEKEALEREGVFYSDIFKHFTEDFQKLVFGVIDVNQTVLFPFVSDSIIRDFNPVNGRAKVSLNYWEHPDKADKELTFVADRAGAIIPFTPPIKEEEYLETLHQRCRGLIWNS